MMNPIVKEKWVKALRSGEYKQGHDALNVYDKFCCLGVLCDLYIKETGLAKWRKDEGISIVKFELGISSCEALPPKEVNEWVGIQDIPDGISTVRILYKGEVESFANLNDSKKLTFEQIADIIEEQL